MSEGVGCFVWSRVHGWCVAVPVWRYASVLSRLPEDCHPSAILDNNAILAQLVNGTAHGPRLVLYTPAVSCGYCGEICGLR